MSRAEHEWLLEGAGRVDADFRVSGEVGLHIDFALDVSVTGFGDDGHREGVQFLGFGGRIELDIEGFGVNLHDFEGLRTAKDQDFLDRVAGLQITESDELGADGDIPLDVGHEPQGYGSEVPVIGLDEDLALEGTGGCFWFEGQIDAVFNAASGAADFFEFDGHVRIVARDADDFPVGATGVIEIDSKFASFPFLDIPEDGFTRIEDDIAADVAFDGKLHFGELRFVEGDGDGGLFATGVGMGVELGENDANLPRGNRFREDTRGRAIAAGPNTSNVDGLTGSIFEFESVFSVGSASDAAKIVARLAEHAACPVIG